MSRRWPWQSGERMSSSWWIVFVSGSLVVVFSIAIARELIRSQQVRTQVARLHDQVQAEADRHQQLEELIAYLSSQTFQEREARLKLGLRKPGERVIVVPPGSVVSSNQDATVGSGTESGQPGLDRSLPMRWWDYFFGPKTAAASQTDNQTVQ